MTQTVSRHQTPSAESVLAIIDGLVAELHAGRRVRAQLTSSFDRELGLDSLARVEMLARIERNFGVRLPEAVLENAETPRDLLVALGRGDLEKASLVSVNVEANQSDRVVGLPDVARSLVEVLEWHVARHPRRRHVSFYCAPEKIETLNYGELSEGARGVAGALMQCGVRQGHCVGLMLPSGLDFFRCFFGILYAGAIPVPLYPPARRSQIEDHLKRQARILENCEAHLLISFEEVRPLTRLLTGLVPTLKRVVSPAELEGDSSLPPFGVAAGDIALLQYTSGSTGDPKGVTLTHANLLANIRGWGAAVGVSSADVCVSWLPLYHDMGLIGAWLGSLYHACQLILMSPLDFLARPERWLWAIHRHRGTVTAAPNFAFDLCVKRLPDLDLTGLDLSSWRFAANGAEPVRAESLERFAAAFGVHGLRPEALAPVYGLAECTVGLSISPPGRGLLAEYVERDALIREGKAVPVGADRAGGLRFVCCGRPLADHDVRVVDDEGVELPERYNGRLEFRGPSATSGYYRNPEANRALFDGDWLDSGDLAYIANGEIYITGRIKDLIIRGGRNFYPYDLEQAVGALPGVRKGCVAVFGVQARRDAAEEVVVVAETREADPDSRARLEQQIVSLGAEVLGLPPDRVVLATPHAVLKTSSGKIRRAEIRERYVRGELENTDRAPSLQFVRLAGQSVLHRAAFLLRELPAFVYGAWTWLLFTTLSAIAVPAIMVLPRFDQRWRVVRGLVRALIALVGIRLIVSGREHMPEGPCVLVSNHASYIDALVLVASIARPVSFVSKAELRRHWALGRLLPRLGVQFVERFDSRQSIEDAKQLATVANGATPLLFFAEGTFTRRPGLREFRLGAFQVAAKLGLRVVPVVLAGTREALPDGVWRLRRMTLKVTISPPVMPEGAGWHGVLALRERTHGEILKHCGERQAAD